jgi:hypothetical protein
MIVRQKRQIMHAVFEKKVVLQVHPGNKAEARQTSKARLGWPIVDYLDMRREFY